MQCKAGTSTGEFVGSRLKSETLVLTGCELTSSKAQCQTLGAGAGEIKTSSLVGELGFIVKAAKPTVGWTLTSTGPSIAAITCGAVQSAITGSVIAPVSAVDKMRSSFALKYKASKGKQKPEALEKGAIETLVWNEGSSHLQLGLSATETITTEEALEVKAL